MQAGAAGGGPGEAQGATVGGPGRLDALQPLVDECVGFQALGRALVAGGRTSWRAPAIPHGQAAQQQPQRLGPVLTAATFLAAAARLSGAMGGPLGLPLAGRAAAHVMLHGAMARMAGLPPAGPGDLVATVGAVAAEAIAEVGRTGGGGGGGGDDALVAGLASSLAIPVVAALWGGEEEEAGSAACFARLEGLSAHPGALLLLTRQAEMDGGAAVGGLAGHGGGYQALAAAAEQLLQPGAGEEGRATALLLGLAVRLQDGAGPGAAAWLARLLRVAAAAQRLRQGLPAAAVADWPEAATYGLLLGPHLSGGNLGRVFEADQTAGMVEGRVGQDGLVGAALAALPGSDIPTPCRAAIVHCVLVEGLGVHAVLAAAGKAGSEEGEQGWVGVARVLHAAEAVL